LENSQVATTLTFLGKHKLFSLNFA